MSVQPSALPDPSAERYDPGLLTDRPASVAALFRDRVRATPDRLAFQYPTTDAEGRDTWHDVTWAAADARVRRLAAGLLSLGVEPEQRVAVASGTRYEWVLADLAVMLAGGATTTVYPTTIADDVAYILADSESVVVAAEDAVQLAKLEGIRDAVPGVRRVVVLDGDVAGAADPAWVMTLDQLEEAGRDLLDRDPGAVDARIESTRPEQLATLIYTSGTTGRPKGVRLLHRTWTYQAASTRAMDILGPDDLQYLWLPLAHVFGKQLLTINLAVGFATAIDGRIDRIVPNLAVVRPTFMGAAPRIFEKAHAAIAMAMAAEGGARFRIFEWAVGVGGRVADVLEEGREPSALLAAKHRVADRLVLEKVRARFGGRIRFFISGSAALNHDVARFFYAVGLPVAEGYGLTESSSAAFVNRVLAWRIGSVGWAVPGLEVRIAEDGEVLLRGEGIMDGYHHDAEATAEAIDADGWFHTGDIGELDDRSFLRITDRKKDLFKTSGGKYVAPAAIESSFKGMCPFVSQLVVHGDGRNFVSALVTLDPDAIGAWAAAHGMAGRPYAEVVASPEVRALVADSIDQLNGTLNRWETIKRFTILDHDLSVEAGELTPSLKLKRKVVTDRFADVLDAHYR